MLTTLLPRVLLGRASTLSVFARYMQYYDESIDMNSMNMRVSSDDELSSTEQKLILIGMVELLQLW